MGGPDGAQGIFVFAQKAAEFMFPINDWGWGVRGRFEGRRRRQGGAGLGGAGGASLFGLESLAARLALLEPIREAGEDDDDHEDQQALE